MKNRWRHFQKGRLRATGANHPIGFGQREWGRSLADFVEKNAPQGAIESPETTESRMPSAEPLGWWEKAFADKPTDSEIRGHRCGEREMLMIVAYDIRKPRRLRQIAKHCEDYGIRIQYSMFECRLAADMFDQFWWELKDLVDPKEDRIVAYRVCAECAKDVRALGCMVFPETKVVAYVF